MGSPNRLNYPEDDRPHLVRDPHAPHRKLDEVPDPPEQRNRSRGFWIGVIILVALVLLGVAIFLSGVKQSGPAKPANNSKIAPPGMFLLP